jgi:uncharacterized protein involved in cysteine biosynthesis
MKPAAIVSRLEGEATRLTDGLVAPMAGLRYLLAHPSLLRYALPALVVTGSLLALGLWTAFTRADDLLALLWARPEGDGWLVAWLLGPLWQISRALLTVGLGVVLAVAAHVLGSPVAGPFLELLSERVEAIETGYEAPFRLRVLWLGIRTGLRNGLLLLGAQIGVFVASTIIGFVPVVGPVVGVVLLVVVTPLGVGLTQLDAPTNVRLFTLAEKAALLRRNFPLWWGFSLTTFAMLYVPFVNLALAPACVVGATLLLLRIERQGGLPGLDRRKLHVGPTAPRRG